MDRSIAQGAKLIAAIALLALVGCAHVAATTEPGPHFRFASVEEARALLGGEDAFTRALTPADLTWRFGDAAADYRARAAAAARDWDEAEQRKMEEAIALLERRLQSAGVHLPLPPEVLLVQSTGAEEGGAGNYTRGAAIIIPENQMERTPAELAGVLAHELFHVATRYRPEMRRDVYAIFGFTPCAPPALSQVLAARRITNPDAAHLNYCIHVSADGRAFDATPLILLGEINPNARSIFDNIEVRLLDIAPGERLYALDDVTGYFEQIGGNTDYIIHAEEISADNFSLMLREATGLPNPEKLDQLRALLQRPQ